MTNETPDADAAQGHADAESAQASAGALDPQPIPEAARCPECGTSPPTDPDSEYVNHNLSALGYMHDDVSVTCPACDHTWTMGIPIGEYETPESENDLVCDACGDIRCVHRVVLHTGPVRQWLDGDVPACVGLHLKCPTCKDFTTAIKHGDIDGRVLVGNPRTTGQTAGADPYGYTQAGVNTPGALDADTAQTDADAESDQQ